MKKISENTQGARLRRAQTISTHIQNFGNYNPSHPDDQAANFNALVQQLEQMSLAVTTAQHEYRLATDERQRLFRRDEFSAMKILPYLRNIGAVAWGKDSKSYEVLAGLIAKTRVSRAGKRGELAIGAAAEGEVRDAPSRSQQSYASLQWHFKKIVEWISGATYHTNIPQLQPQALQQLVAQIAQVQELVEQRETQYEQLLQERVLLERRVEEAIERICKYVRFAYGKESAQYVAVS